MSRSRDRGFRKTNSQNGELGISLRKDVTERINRHCEATDQNRTRFVESAVIEKLDRLDELANLIDSRLKATGPDGNEQQIVYTMQEEAR